MAKILSMPASVAPTPQSYSILSAGVLQNNATLRGSMTQQTGYIRLNYQSTGYIDLAAPVSGYGAVKVSLRSPEYAGSYTRVTVAGHSVTAAQTTDLQMLTIPLVETDVIGNITFEALGGTNPQNIYDVWLEPPTTP